MLLGKGLMSLEDFLLGLNTSGINKQPKVKGLQALKSWLEARVIFVAVEGE